jgi:adenosylmethionine-8-amino-7-oxononanoate aminotransferase
MICLAKGLGAGFPMGAIAYTDRVQEKLYIGAHGSTFGGNPLASAAGLAAIQTYQDENLIARAAVMGAFFLRRLREELAAIALVRDVRADRADAGRRIAPEGRPLHQGADGGARRDRAACRPKCDPFSAAANHHRK